MRLSPGEPCSKHPENLKRSKDGRCTKCESERRMDYRARNLEKELARRAATRDHENELARKRHSENPEPRRESVRKWQKNNPDKVRADNVRRYHEAPEYHRARVKAWAKKNPDKLARRQQEWRRANPDIVRAMNQRQYAKSDKQQRLDKGRAWQDANREKVRASVRKWNNENVPDRKAASKARQLRAVPSWANDFFVKEAYRLARLRSEMLGFKWQVDHIVPLVNKRVCGLHCEANLQVIPAKHNAAKGNRWWPDMPDRA